MHGFVSVGWSAGWVGCQFLSKEQQQGFSSSLSIIKPHPPTLTPRNPPGTIGGNYATPMLNTPEAAIVALGRVRAVPKFDQNGSLTRAHVMGFSWGADHRVVDGATVARFANAWKALLENPASLLAHLR
jgi:2-oxoisovalerate dehydrogenase E2 component (dihydrolipoyl transacylase)